MKYHSLLQRRLALSLCLALLIALLPPPQAKAYSDSPCTAGTTVVSSLSSDESTIRQAYISLLLDIKAHPQNYYDCTGMFAHNPSLNEFTVADLTGDGILDLAISYYDASYTAAMHTTVWSYKQNTNQVYVIDYLGANSLFYPNGIVESLASHNHSLGSIWPTTYSRFNGTTFNNFADISSWEKSLTYDNTFPEEQDIDHDGIIVFYTPVNGETSAMTMTEYNSWLKKTLGNASPLPRYQLTTENIQTVLANTQTTAQIKVSLNGSPLVFDQSPIIENGRTLVPLRTIFEAMETTVQWNGQTQTISARRGGKNISLTPGSSSAKIGDKTYFLEVPPKIVNGRTLVPVRFVAESLDSYVYWNQASKTVEITDNQGAYTIARVKAYAAECDTKQIEAVQNSTLSNAEKYVQLSTLYNNASLSADERWHYEGLYRNAPFVSWQFKEYLSQSWQARLSLDLSALTFAGEIWDYPAGIWPEKEKYKEMLRSFISETHQQFEQIETINQFCELFDAMLEPLRDQVRQGSLEAGADAIQRILEARQTLRAAPLSDSEIAAILADTYKQYARIAKSDSTLKNIRISAQIGEIAGIVLDATDAGLTAYTNYTFAVRNANLFETYADLFQCIEKTDKVPLALRVAAQEICTELHQNYLTIVEQFSRKVGGTLLEGFAEMTSIPSLAYLGTFSLAATVSDLALGMRTLTDSATYTEGYVYLAEVFSGQLQEKRSKFLSQYNTSYQAALTAATDFKHDYTILQELRIAAERAYLKMASFDGAWLKVPLQWATQYQDKEQYCRESIERLSGYTFH